MSEKPRPIRPVDNRNIKTSEDQQSNVFEKVAVLLSYLILVVLFPVAIFFCLLVIPEYERAVVLRLGRLRKGRPKGPGICFVLPCIDDVIRVDMRTASFDVPAQEILTKDSVTIKVDAIVYFNINDPLKAVIQVVDARTATQYLAQTTLRTIAGTKMLIDLLSSRDQLSSEILVALDEATDVWGVKVERVEIRDIKLPISMQRALAQEAEALREARAKLIAAEGEMESSRALKAASDIMQESPITLQITLPKQLQRAMAAEQEAMREAKAKIAAADGELQSSTVLRNASETISQNPVALQLRYLQTLNTVSADKNNTIVIPFPIDLIRKMFGQSSSSSGSGGGDSSEKKEKPKETIIEIPKEMKEPIIAVPEPPTKDFNAQFDLSETDN